MRVQWTTTPERARAVCASLPPVPIEDAVRILRRIIGDEPTVICVPSPFAAVMVAAACHSPPATGRTIAPASVADACAMLGAAPSLDAVPWTDHQYAVRPRHMWTIHWSPAYYRGYISVAIDGGHSMPDMPEWARIGADAVLTTATAAIIVEAPTSITAHEPIGVIVRTYADGTRVAARGWSVCPPRLIVEPHTATAAQIDATADEDVRGWAIDHYAGPGTSPSAGWMRYLEELGAAVLDERANDIEGTHEALFAARDRSVLVATCPTARLVALSVPPEIRTCAEAQAWLHRGRRIVGRT